MTPLGPPVTAAEAACAHSIGEGYACAAPVQRIGPKNADVAAMSQPAQHAEKGSEPMFGTAVRRIPLSIPAQENESFDIEDMASQAADALEAYRRAPWLQLNQRTRLAKLHHAIELLERIEALETGLAHRDPGELKERAQAGRA